MKNSTYKITEKNLDLELKSLLESDLKKYREVKNKNNQVNGPLLAA